MEEKQITIEEKKDKDIEYVRSSMRAGYTFDEMCYNAHISCKRMCETLCAILEDEIGISIAPVIRCKDCEHFCENENKTYFDGKCERNDYFERHYDDFCSGAERKESD